MNRFQSLQQRLLESQTLIGLLQAHPNSTFSELAGMCGYDFLLLDGEHGVFGENDYLQTLQVLASTNTLTMIRLRAHDPTAIGRYLDMGADAIVVPNVATAEQARAMVRAMDYPPAGTRGHGASLHRAAHYGMDLQSHVPSTDRRASLFAIIESGAGIANIDEIASIDGVDGVVVGPSDLSADLGCGGDFFQPKYTQAVDLIERAAKASGKIIGGVPHPGYPLESLLARGYQLLILGTDTALIRESMASQIEKARTLSVQGGETIVRSSTIFFD